MNFGGDWSVEAAQTPMLGVAHLTELAEWSEAVITDAEEKTTSKGGKYACITFKLTDAKLSMRMNYFRPQDILPLLNVLNLQKLENKDQVVGKKLSLKFDEEEGEFTRKDGTVGTKSYVRIAQYAAKKPVTGSTVIGEDIDEVPF